MKYIKFFFIFKLLKNPVFLSLLLLEEPHRKELYYESFLLRSFMIPLQSFVFIG